MADLDGRQVILLGAFRGGYAVVELIHRAVTGICLPALTGWPESLARLAGTTLLYLYCGLANADARANLRVG